MYNKKLKRLSKRINKNYDKFKKEVQELRIDYNNWINTNNNLLNNYDKILNKYNEISHL